MRKRLSPSVIILVMMVGLAPILTSLVETYDLTAGNLLFQLTKPTPTITPIPLQQAEAVFIAQRTETPVPEPTGRGEEIDLAISTATAVGQNYSYSPPPTLSADHNSHAYIGKYGMERGIGYSKNLTLKIGSLSNDREGRNSFWNGADMDRARHLLQQEYPEVEAYLFERITSELLSQVDVFIITSGLIADGYGHTVNHYDKLTVEEQAALRQFVENGGWLLAALSVEPGGFIDISTESARDIAAAFDAEVTTVVPKWPNLHMAITPEEYRVMNEPWGDVRQVYAIAPIAFGDLGPYTQPLILGGTGDPMSAIIEPDALMNGSGMVLFIPKQILRSLVRGDNAYLFLNFIDLALQAKVYALGDSNVPAPASKLTISVTPTVPSVMPTRVSDTMWSKNFNRGLPYMKDVPLRFAYLEQTNDRHVNEGITMITYEYPESTFTEISTLRDRYLEEIDIVLLAPGRGAALTAEEQSSLKQFVTDGGCALIAMEDPYRLNGLGETMAKMVEPFGMSINWARTYQEKKPDDLLPFESNGTPLLDGPWGKVKTITNYDGLGITSAGPFGMTLIQNQYGGAVVAIPPRTLSPDSGPVMVLASKAVLGVGGSRSRDDDILLGNFVEQCHHHIIAANGS